MTMIRAFVAAVGLSAAVFAQGPGTLVYFNDFESGTVGPEWTHSGTSTTPIGGRRFLGELGGGDVSFGLQSIFTTNRVRIAFDLFIIRSWDGNGEDPSVGPDTFSIVSPIVGTIMTTSFRNPPGSGTQAFPGRFPGDAFPPRTGAVEIDSLGYLFGGSPSDAVYHIDLTFCLVHSGPPYDLFLTFRTPTTMQALGDESWGIDNFAVYVVPDGPGQANGPSASLLVNGVGGGCSGPFPVNVPTAGTLRFDWAGPAGAPIALFHGPINAGAFVDSCFGSIDLGVLPLFQDVQLVLDGTASPLFRITPAGTATFTTSVGLPPGPLGGFQGAVIQVSGPPCDYALARLTAAFTITVQ